MQVGQFELATPPNDGITNVTFCPNTQLLLVSSWDSVWRLLLCVDEEWLGIVRAYFSLRVVLGPWGVVFVMKW
jgi:hypothetical protein